MVVVTSVFGLGVILPLVVGVPFRNGSYYTTTCDDPKCAKTAHQLLEWLDPDVNPCQDFFQFTCGRKINSLEDHTARNDEVNEELRRILEGPPMKKEIKCHKLLRQFYSLCMNEAQINQRGVSPGVTLLRQLGRWPLLDESWSEDLWRLEKAESKLHRYGLGGGLFYIHVDMDRTDLDKNVIYIDVPNSREDETSMIKSMFPKVSDKTVYNKSREEIIDVILSVAKEINVSKTAIKESMMDAVLFHSLLQKTIKGGNNEEKERKFERIIKFKSTEGMERRSISEEDNQGDWGHPKVTVSQMQAKVPGVDWKTLLENILQPLDKLKTDEVVLVSSFEYLLRLGVLLKSVPKKSVANYMMWNAALKMANYLSADISALAEVKSGDKRWQHCVKQSTTRGLSLALASLVARKHSDDSAIQRALIIAKDLQGQLVNDLEEEDWVDNPSRKRAQRKISLLKFFIGYPTELLDNDKMNGHYKKIKMDTVNYFEATMDLLKWEQIISWGKLRLSAKANDWQAYDTTTLFTKNAFNNMLMNEITITGPELIFQNTFNSKVPLYIAYGDVGTTVGHELIHSLDNNGLFFNEKGNFEIWVTSETLDNFTDRAQCIIDQYSSFKDTTYTQLTVDGDATQGETISDNSGLKVAYNAYRRAANRRGPEQGLPGLQHYTPDQLFFITAANYYCEIPDKEHLAEVIKDDPHPPNQFRVLGMMMNSPIFSKAFKCGGNDAMNPPDKCEVW